MFQRSAGEPSRFLGGATKNLGASAILPRGDVDIFQILIGRELFGKERHPATGLIMRRCWPKTRGKKMKKSVFAPTVWGLFAILTSGGAFAALPLVFPGPTVNDYTARQSQRTEAAARSAGFGDLEIVMVQDCNVFLNGQKEGQSYSLTVTRDGQVYFSSRSQAVKS